MKEPSLESVKNSALWAAWGDALGFVTEFRDSEGLKRKIKAARVATTVPWQRMVGGRFGALVDLPAGTYSDDTQLRLATSRAIRGDSHFDVEAFAKIELPVWQCYSLGGGKGTKAAASALTRLDANWFSNFFDYPEVKYLQNGGNGAAMRIQPHVWSSRDRANPRSFLRDVIRNAVCTHGHPRGILGAVFHSVCLAATFDQRRIPGPDLWTHALECFRDAAGAIRADGDLSSFWLPVWEERIGARIEEAFEQVAKELSADIEVIGRYVSGSPQGYKEMVEAIGGLAPETRGSATKTALIAAALSFMFRDSDPTEGLLTAANLLFSDTDTIATMCGALLGVVADNFPGYPVLDSLYIEREAMRMYEISCERITQSFGYPDLGQWRAPRSQLDSVGRVDDHRFGVSGLGFAEPVGEEYRSRARDQRDAVWQWLRLDFGQSIVAKRRAKSTRLLEGNMPKIPVFQAASTADRVHDAGGKPAAPEQPRLFMPSVGAEREAVLSVKSLDQLTDEAIRSGFGPATIGRHLLELAEQPDGIERAVAYASIIAKAKMARSRIVRKQKTT